MPDTYHYSGENKLHLNVLKDHEAITKEAAQIIAKQLREKPDSVIGLATGATMEPVYTELARMHKEEGLDFSKARFFNLDAYKGIPSTDRNSYDFQLRKLLINKVNATPENVKFVQGENFDPQAYEREIKKAGGIDIQLLGLGGEGHIGFNEVGSDINSRTREVRLSERTREDNSIYFNRPGETVPDSAYTMGIGTILEAKKIIMLANNPNKALAIRKMMDPAGTETGDHNPVASLPARALHAHANPQNVHLLVDEEAAQMVSEQKLIRHSNLKAREAANMLEQFKTGTLQINTPQGPKNLMIPARMDFYDPNVMSIDEKFDRKNPRHVKALQQALSNTTDVCIGAHQDDAEIMAGPQMLEATRDPKRKWTTIIVTDGAASKSILTGMANELSPKQLTDMRQREQREAAQMMGTPVIQLKYPSAAINGHMGADIRRETGQVLAHLFRSMPKLETVFGHNPLDKHDTHIGTLAVQTEALRMAKPPQLKKVYGMEVWGGLTGLPESMLSMWPVESKDDIKKIYDLIHIFQSQILGQGRDYAEGTVSRIKGHGNYVSSPHLSNPPEGIVIGVDMTNFTRGHETDIGEYASELLLRAAKIKVSKASRYPVGDTGGIGDHSDEIIARDSLPRISNR